MWVLSSIWRLIYQIISGGNVCKVVWIQGGANIANSKMIADALILRIGTSVACFVMDTYCRPCFMVWKYGRQHFIIYMDFKILQKAFNRHHLGVKITAPYSRLLMETGRQPIPLHILFRFNKCMIVDYHASHGWLAWSCKRIIKAKFCAQDGE